MAVRSMAAACVAAGSLGTAWLLRDQFSLALSVSAATVPPPAPSSPVADMESASTGDIMRHGYPTFLSIKERRGHVVAYDRRHRTAAWVCEHLSPARLRHRAARREHTEFREDESDPQLFRARLSDYRGSGFDRGHLAPAADMRHSQAAMQDTFWLSNMSPQVGKGFNRGIWNDLETHVRDAAERHDNTWVITGPLYVAHGEGKSRYVQYQVIGDGLVSVPTHFFKVIALEKRAGAGISAIEAYMLPNQETSEVSRVKSANSIPVHTHTHTHTHTHCSSHCRRSVICSGSASRLPRLSGRQGSSSLSAFRIATSSHSSDVLKPAANGTKTRRVHSQRTETRTFDST
jgi:endonuclease G, mitochondrial